MIFERRKEPRYNPNSSSDTFCTADGDSLGSGTPYNPFLDKTSTHFHDGMWVTSIDHRMTVIADYDRDSSIRRAVELHQANVDDFQQFLSTGVF